MCFMVLLVLAVAGLLAGAAGTPGREWAIALVALLVISSLIKGINVMRSGRPAERDTERDPDLYLH